jgi:hypothetical protein
MRGYLVLALSIMLGLGCAAESPLSIDGSSGNESGGNSGNSGNSGSTGGASGGTAGHASGGATGGSTGGASGGTAGHGSGGASGGATGGSTGGASGGTAGHASGGATGHASGGTTGTGGSSGGTTGHASGGATGSGGATASGGATGTGGTTGTGGATGSGGGAGQAGNPNGSCKAGVPANGQPADVSSPTSVIGTGTAASCTFAALNTAVGKGGVITFNCGSGAVTIAITATMSLPINENTVIDGGNKVTLDGGHAVQILNFNSTNFQTNTNGLTLQHLTLVNGKTNPTALIPAAPQAACSQGYDDGQGGALYMRDGNLLVVDCIFDGNQAAPLGPDTGGGAIYIEGSKNGTVIVGSTFTNNSGANAGAVGSLIGELDIYNSLFENNTATGHDANGNDTSMTMCTVMNNGQYEVGSGGNGGAIYGDGNGFNVILCGDAVLNNAAGKNAFGGGLFFTSDDMSGVLSITDTTITGNTGGSWTNVTTGSVTNVGTAIGVNAKSITVSNSTLQGM